MRARTGALCGGLAVVACLLSACTPTAGRPTTASPAELDTYRGDNGLLSNVAVASFDTARVADTAYAVRIDRLIPPDLRDDDRAAEGDVLPSSSRWRQLWQQDADDPLWKAHAVCSVLDPAAARAVVGAEAAAIVDDAREKGVGLARIEEAAVSLDVLAAVHVTWCLAGDDLLGSRPRPVERIIAAVSSNAALALQWIDVLEAMGRPPARIEVSSAYLEGSPPAACDDRTALEAAAALLLTPSTATPARERCAIDDALDSDDPQVLLSALRAAVRGGIERRADAVRSIAAVVSARRGPDGEHRRPARVSGSLNGTLAGLRLLTADGRVFGAAETADVLDLMTREARAGSGDALLVLAACATLRGTCGALVEEGVLAGQAIAADTDDTAAALDGLLAALALARPVDPERIDAIVDALAARPFRGCARTQVAVFREVAATGAWQAAARTAARADFREAALAADLTGYCDFSWAARLASPVAATAPATPSTPSTPSAGEDAVRTLPVGRDGLLQWGDQPAPLSVAAAAADLDLYEGNPTDD